MSDTQRPGASAPTSTTSSAPKKSGPSFSLGQVLAGILLVLVVVFIAENTEKVKIRFIVGPQVETPVYLALLIAAVVGALVASLLRLRRKHNHG